jgi:hypothetical protein
VIHEVHHGPSNPPRIADVGIAGIAAINRS